MTSTLYPFSGLEKIDADVVARAAERGTKVHKICEGIIAGLGEHGVDEETWGYVESFKKWWGDGHEVIAMEKRFWCDELEITGQVDLIIRTSDDRIIIVDLKTSSRPSKTWPAQMSAYAYLANKENYNVTETYCLHLNKHGKHPKLIGYPVDPSFFLAIWLVYNHFYRKG